MIKILRMVLISLNKEKTSVDLDQLRIELKGYTDKETGEVRTQMSSKITDMGE